MIYGIIHSLLLIISNLNSYSRECVCEIFEWPHRRRVEHVLRRKHTGDRLGRLHHSHMESDKWLDEFRRRTQRASGDLCELSEREWSRGCALERGLHQKRQVKDSGQLWLHSSWSVRHRDEQTSAQTRLLGRQSKHALLQSAQSSHTGQCQLVAGHKLARGQKNTLFRLELGQARLSNGSSSGRLHGHRR